MFLTCQVAKIETEKMLIQMVETELEKRRLEGAYNGGQFKGQSHFFGYPFCSCLNFCYFKSTLLFLSHIVFSSKQVYNLLSLCII